MVNPNTSVQLQTADWSTKFDVILTVMRATQVVVNNSGLNRIQTLASTKCRDQGSHPILEYIIHYCLGSAPNHNEHMNLCASKPMLPSNEKHMKTGSMQMPILEQ